MDVVARVESVWRYPVKSMRGEEMESVYAGVSGIYGDRVFAIHDTAAPTTFPYFTGRQWERMLLLRPRFRDPERACAGWSHRNGDPEDLMVDVEMPDGRILGIDDPALLLALGEGLREGHQLSLLRSSRAMTDASPVSLFSVQTAQQLGDDLGIVVDKRRFRANVYLDFLGSAGMGGAGFAEDRFVGHSVRLGEEVVLAVLERDPRCKMITLDPDTAEANPDIMKQVARAYDRSAGVYAAVLVEGMVRRGDTVRVLT